MTSSARGLQLASATARYISTASLRSQPLPNSLRTLSSVSSSRSYTATAIAPRTQKQTQCRSYSATRSLHGRVVEPLIGTGPPPDAPVPAPEYAPSKRRAKVAKALKMMRDAKDKAAMAASSGEITRFWKTTSVRETNGMYEVLLDSRPLRRPDDKQIIRIPLSKPHLANALALEWDQLTSSREATKNHLLPLTSLVSRAIDIAADDAKTAHQNPNNPEAISPLREGLANMLLRYLDTDSLLCWSPPVDPSNPAAPSSALDNEGKSLRDRQEAVYNQVVPFLMAHVWPGVSKIIPVLDDNFIMPKSQDPATRATVQTWIERDLDAWEVAGLERATLAAKSLLIGARLIAEWGETFSSKVGAKAAIEKGEGRELFGIEEAARAASIEVDWQIERWGEVEDTHDVEKVDVRRQLGGVVLLVSGTRSSNPN
ncbi:protein atp12, mitochondrial [Rhypophila decipiens]|uniref:Protein atp12, mitochondrial n=1 Tax=Rhypophila decipiens TaxID=261697 RepID=A0AAN6YEV3_9PEZI|nr:protein atp12, mitochondrial [Rhypophila decipiens]